VRISDKLSQIVKTGSIGAKGAKLWPGVKFSPQGHTGGRKLTQNRLSAGFARNEHKSLYTMIFGRPLLKGSNFSGPKTI